MTLTLTRETCGWPGCTDPAEHRAYRWVRFDAEKKWSALCDWHDKLATYQNIAGQVRLEEQVHEDLLEWARKFLAGLNGRAGELGIFGDWSDIGRSDQ